jgi:hypothetical protein
VSFDIRQVTWVDGALGEVSPPRSRASDKLALFAPDAIERDGKYYLYFCLSDDSEGVAVASSPLGPFALVGRLPVSGIDPAVFLDDDGTAYYYWGQHHAKAARLTRDLCAVDQTSIVENIVTSEQHSFHEGSSVRKRDGLYYYVFADESRGKPTALGYATSTRPLGPFVYRGIIIDNVGCDPQTWNNHGSIEEFQGKWYVFYHRSSRNSRSMRRVCAEPITFTEDGAIPEVSMTSQGPGDPFQAGEFIPAWSTCGLTGTAYLDVFEKSEALVSISDGDTAAFRYIRLDHASALNLDIRGQGTIDVIVDDTPCGSSNATGSNSTVRIPPGTHELRLRFHNPRGMVLLGATCVPSSAP